MEEFEIVLGLLVAVTFLVSLARRLRVPYPILLVLGGSALGFIPGLPQIEIDPELLLLIFLPPLIQSAAYFTSIRDFRANLRPIGLLAVALPLFTMTLVAIVAHLAVPQLPWAAAFVLGAIISPPDAVATTAVASGLSIPRRIITVLEGESLVNDATALVAYRLAVAAVVTGTFSIWEAGLSFVVTGGGGLIIGLIVGWLATKLLSYVNDTPIEILIGILMGFSAYLLAERLGVSGVLAVVAAGVILGRNEAVVLTPESRLQSRAVWEILVFLLNGLVFILIGLQLNKIVTQLEQTSYTTGQLIWYAVLISLTVMIGRIVWVFPATYWPRRFSRRIRESDPAPPWQSVAIISWAGMRGMVSLAVALALPEQTASGERFPGHSLIIFLTFCVILVTLVLQGLSLAPIIKFLGLEQDDGADREEANARMEAARAGSAKLEQLAGEDWAPQEVVDGLRTHYDHIQARYAPRAEGNKDDGLEQGLENAKRLRREVVQAERDSIIKLRGDGDINDEVLRRVEADLDIEEQRLVSEQEEEAET